MRMKKRHSSHILQNKRAYPPPHPVATKRIKFIIAIPDEQKQQGDDISREKEGTDMIALAPVATVRVLGNSNAKHTNKMISAALS
jgi:hypothetical protein